MFLSSRAKEPAEDVCLPIVCTQVEYGNVSGAPAWDLGPSRGPNYRLATRCLLSRLRYKKRVYGREKGTSEYILAASGKKVSLFAVPSLYSSVKRRRKVHPIRKIMFFSGPIPAI